MASLHCYPNNEAEEIPFIAPDLPQELLISILIRLPIGSLLRCRRVCRSWRALIASPLFISSHHDHQSAAGRRTLLVRRCQMYGGSSASARYTLNSDDDSLSQIAQFDSPLASAHAVPRILGSVNGLICLVNDTSLIFWNPAIRKSLFITSDFFGVNYNFSNSPRLGFGFDPAANDYKVVRVDYDNTGPCAQIYRLSTHSWSMIQLNPEPSNLPLLFPRQAYLNGVVHWLAHDSTIVGLDLRTENFRVLKLPCDFKDKRMTDVAIAAWCGFLALFEFQNPNICLWVMKKYDMVESWIRQCVISSNGIDSPIRVKSIGSNGKILIEYSSGNLSWFDPATHNISELTIQDRGNVAMLHMKPFTKSLVLLNDARAGFVASSTLKLGRWSHEEDKLLARAWLKFSKDQGVKSLWSQIEAYFGMHKQGGKTRGLSNLQQHWYRINKAVSKFHVCYSSQLHNGGLDESGILLKAYRVYKEEENADFRHEHVWRLLKDEPRWVDAFGGDGGGSSKRAKVTDSGVCRASSDAETSDANAATRKGKAPQSSQTEEIQKHTRALELNAEMKKKELEMKQREMDLQIIYKDTSGTTEAQRVLHRQLLEGASKRLKADPKFNV